MQNFLDQAPCLYFSSSDEGNILEVNERLCSVLQYSREEVIGKKTDALLTIPSRIFQQTHFFPLLKMQQHVEEIYITLQRKNGEQLPVLMNAERKIIDGAAVNIYVGIIVHNRKKFEDELIAAKKTAENALNENTALLQAKQELQKHTEKLDQQFFITNKQNEELRQFNRVVTHDMQEPLRKLSLFSGMLLEDDGQREAKAIVQKIKKVTGQMHGILSGLQQYVWLNETPVKIQPVQLSNLLEKLVHQLNTEFPGTNIQVETEGIDTFDGDPDQMKLLLYQLLSNSIRFKKENEAARIFISVEQIRLNQFRHIGDKYKFVEYTRFKVRDCGKGFSAEYATQVFELFRRLHTESGRGVGLSLCKKITDNHQGIICIDSKPGEGTEVTIHLPLHSLPTLQDTTKISINTTEHQ